MRRMSWVCLSVFGIMLTWGALHAADYFIVPVKKCCTCEGTRVGTRWCDNGDGTVTDLTTCLVWLKFANWGGEKPWRNTSTNCGSPNYTCFDDAHTRAGRLANGEIIYQGSLCPVRLFDGSEVGDWRLPTKTELEGIASGEESVHPGDAKAFMYVYTGYYWTSTTHATNTSYAWSVDLETPDSSFADKGSNRLVWPVRGPK